MAYRLDKGRINKARYTTDGRLIADGAITRVGVFSYRNPDGTERLEYRPPEEVFKADSLESFAHVPLTNDHPSELLNSRNAKQHTIGAVGESVRQDGEHVVASIVCFDALAVAEVKAGKAELSCGYSCEVDETPGETPDGERYDAIQRNIVGNHVAIVSHGRAGPTARLRLDSAVSSAFNITHKHTMRTDMDPEKLAEHNAALLLEKATLTVKVTQAEARADAAEKTSEALEAKLAEATKRTDAIESGLEARVEAAVQLRADAAKHLPKDFDFSGKSSRAIKEAAIVAISGDENFSERTDEYVDARYDAQTKAPQVAKKDSAATETPPASSDADPRQVMLANYKKRYDSFKGTDHA